MKSKWFMFWACTVLVAVNGPSLADHNSMWFDEGWANMPNDIHNTRIEGDQEEFLALVQQGGGAESVNRYLEEETRSAHGKQGQGSGKRPFDELSIRLDPEQDIQGSGRALYKVFVDEQALYERAFIVNVRLRLITANGSAANEILGLTEENAPDNIMAYLAREAAAEEFVDYAVCEVPFDQFVRDEYDVAYYVTYRLELKEQGGEIADPQGICVGTSQTAFLPEVVEYDTIEIGVATDATPGEVRPVMTGEF